MKQSFANFLTFDIEEWYHANYEGMDFSAYENQPTNLEGTIDQIIDLCAGKRIQSTCFILGKIARKKPQVVKKLHAAGHEIASHGCNHTLVHTMTPKQFEEDLRTSIDHLEQLTGEKICGFRAPSWSVKADMLPWYYEILQKLKLTYSSSVYPAYTFLYGIPAADPFPHYPVVDGKIQSVLEIPVPIVNIFGKKIGYAGGFYLRLFPRMFIQYVMKRQNRQGRDLFIYLHPRELDADSPKLKLPLMPKMIHYWGLKACAGKLGKILDRMPGTFTTMRAYAGRHS